MPSDKEWSIRCILLCTSRDMVESVDVLVLSKSWSNGVDSSSPLVLAKDWLLRSTVVTCAMCTDMAAAKYRFPIFVMYHYEHLALPV